jgi:UDP-galactopyranose mutase
VVPGRRHRELPVGGRALYADQRIQAHDGPKPPRTTVTYEYPAAEGDPYYPVPRPENQALYKRYEALAMATPNVSFVGRLATYRYYNMDQVVGQALATFRRIAEREGRTFKGQEVGSAIAANG